MKIRYRSKFTGTFIKATDAATKKYAKAVVSELVDKRQFLGRATGYFAHPKKLVRVVIPTIVIKPIRRYEPTTDDDVDIADIREESEWEEYANEYPALDALDDMDNLEDEDEWYEEA